VECTRSGTQNSIRQGEYQCSGTTHSAEAEVHEQSEQTCEALTERYTQDTEYVLQRIYLLGSRVNRASLTCTQAGALRTHTAVTIQHWVQ
jgi:hypothetical protein